MTDDPDLAKRAMQNYRDGQKLTDSVQARIRQLDAATPRIIPPPDDPKRGCISPQGGAGWFKGFPEPAERRNIWNAHRTRT